MLNKISEYGRFWKLCFTLFCSFVLLYLIFPILIIIPLSFNVEPYFTFTEKMLSFDPSGYSLRWYENLFSSEDWLGGIKNSFIIATASTLLATILGTFAALGLAKSYIPGKGVIMATLISPMIVPLIISASGMYFFYVKLGITQTFLGVILAHTVLGTPFVVITVTATLVGFNESLIKASEILGATPFYTFRKVVLPLISPGIISGALFAFITSFDEVVVIIFLGGYEQRTIPIQMWSGIREQISPTVLAVATLLITLTIFLLVTIEILRRKNEKNKLQTP